MGSPEFREPLIRRRIQRPTGVDARATNRISVLGSGRLCQHRHWPMVIRVQHLLLRLVPP